MNVLRTTNPTGNDLSEQQSVTIWLKKACGSEQTSRSYTNVGRRFFSWAEIEPDELLANWKKVKYDYRLREQFIDEWTEKIETYIYGKGHENHTPLSRAKHLAVVVSFFKHHRIPVEPETEKHTYVKYHNRDLTREETKRLLAHTDIRDKTFFLMMLESGLRPNTLVQLRYEHIRKDFEAHRVPMVIELPSELLKDRVEARWTFIGADGFKSLKEYLAPRLPLQNDDVIFQSERSDSTGEYLSPATFSVKFSRVVLKLGITEQREGKPKKLRLYCLRKWFNNNCRYEGFDTAYKEFWMGHTTTQTHYISRDPQRHREEYSKAYPNLRIYKPTESETTQELRKRLEERDKELAQLKENMKKMQPLVEFVNSFDAPENLKEILDFLKDDYIRESSDETLRPLRIEFSEYISNKLDEIAEREGITRKEALEQLVAEDLRILEEGDRRFRKLEKRLRKRP